MTANKTPLQRKYARVVKKFSELKNIDLRQSMDIFYNSQTYQDMKNGIADTHCWSDEYFAEELLMESSV